MMLKMLTKCEQIFIVVFTVIFRVIFIKMYKNGRLCYRISVYTIETIDIQFDHKI